ncbi:MAG: type II toxin-antitoxin system prevent-host-death family antitoxin [Microbacterium sp.]|uniref:type II toxin-antitoxin system Phd/YefM family antitoxin n=1 Tax=Microbacterium sp. TaxID=51671 RepID=UPI0039E6E720
MSRISASVARQTLPAQLDRVEAGEEVAITRHGRVVAVLVAPEVLRNRRASDAWSRADQMGALLTRAREAPLAEPALTAARADALAESVGADRSDR